MVIDEAKEWGKSQTWDSTGFINEMPLKYAEISEQTVRSFLTRLTGRRTCWGSSKEFPISKISVVQTQLTTVKLHTAI